MPRSCFAWDYTQNAKCESTLIRCKHLPSLNRWSSEIFINKYDRRAGTGFGMLLYKWYLYKISRRSRGTCPPEPPQRRKKEKPKGSCARRRAAVHHGRLPRWEWQTAAQEQGRDVSVLQGRHSQQAVFCSLRMRGHQASLTEHKGAEQLPHHETLPFFRIKQRADGWRNGSRLHKAETLKDIYVGFNDGNIPVPTSKTTWW